MKALKETQTIDCNQWPDLILFSSTTGLPKEGPLLPLCQFSYASTRHWSM